MTSKVGFENPYEEFSTGNASDFLNDTKEKVCILLFKLIWEAKMKHMGKLYIFNF